MVSYYTRPKSNLGAKNGMENQEPKKAPETTAESDTSDRSLKKNQGASVESDTSSHQNVEVENQEPKKAPETTAQPDRSPGKDRDL